jgi:NAD(P)-dependent dehydrogenase (short-subunit alcohol dehydrogenase family)
LAVNVIAPYVLTCLVRPTPRVVYISSDMHPSGNASVTDLNWSDRPWNSAQAYSDTKLFVTAFALAVARLRPNVYSNAVDPGWVRTKMGGAGAPVDLDTGSDTQAWLAAGDDIATHVTGGYWNRRRKLLPSASASNEVFQDALMDALARFTGIRLT